MNAPHMAKMLTIALRAGVCLTLQSAKAAMKHEASTTAARSALENESQARNNGDRSHIRHREAA